MTTATPRTTPRKKMNLYFTVEFRRCLDLLRASIGLRTSSSLICNASVQFQMKIRIVSRRRSRSPKYPKYNIMVKHCPTGNLDLHKLEVLNKQNMPSAL